MTADEKIVKPGHSGDQTEFEPTDLGTRGIFVFLFGLVVSGLAIYFIVYGMYAFLDKYEKSQMTTASPLVTSTAAAERVVTQDDMDKAFKDNGVPMLETDERTELRKFLMDQEEQLNSYGWVDEKAGVARIPIERAMQLTVGKLPVYLPGSGDASATAATAPLTHKTVAKGKSGAK